MPEPLSMVEVETIDTEGWGECWHEEEKHQATRYTQIHSQCKTKQREKIEPYTQKRRLGTKRNRDLQIKMDIFIVEIHGISFYSVHI